MLTHVSTVRFYRRQEGVRPGGDYVQGKHVWGWGSAGAGAIQSTLGKPRVSFTGVLFRVVLHLGKQLSALPPQAQDLAVGPG